MAPTIAMPAGSRTEQLPFTVTSVTAARSLLVDDLSAHDVTDRAIEDANIVVGELVMNAVRHGRASDTDTVEISWVVERDRLLFSVRDAGHVDRLVAHMPAPDATGGRGLAMVAMLCEQWSYDTADGTRVTAALRLDAA